MIVRLTITPPPALRPCSTRQTSSTSSEGASAQPTDATANSVTPTTITGRRPTASEIGPWNGLISPNASR